MTKKRPIKEATLSSAASLGNAMRGPKGNRTTFEAAGSYRQTRTVGGIGGTSPTIHQDDQESVLQWEHRGRLGLADVSGHSNPLNDRVPREEAQTRGLVGFRQAVWYQ